jgi:hypothetical protein
MGESGEGVPLPINPKAKAEINSILEKSAADAVSPAEPVKPDEPQPRTSNQQPPSEAQERATYERRWLTEDRRTPGWLTNMKKRKAQPYWFSPRTEDEVEEGDSSPTPAKQAPQANASERKSRRDLLRGKTPKAPVGQKRQTPPSNSPKRN